jgi:hypothetical protein
LCALSDGISIGTDVSVTSIGSRLPYYLALANHGSLTLALSLLSRSFHLNQMPKDGKHRHPSLCRALRPLKISHGLVAMTLGRENRPSSTKRSVFCEYNPEVD